MPVKEGEIQFGNPANILFHLGNIYDDDRDVLNEYVSNASDSRAQNIEIFLHRHGEASSISIFDDGAGMTREEMLRVATSVGESIKALDPETIGEKGIGILGFAAIAKQIDIVSRSFHDQETYRLTFSKGSEKYKLSIEKQNRLFPGTTVYLKNISKERMRLFTLQKLEEYFKRRCRGALLENRYKLSISDRKQKIEVKPDQYKGEKFYISSIYTDRGDIKLSLHILPSPSPRNRVSVYGKGGVLILEDIAIEDDFNGPPWDVRQVQGEITFPHLLQKSGRRAVEHDEVFWPAFCQAVKNLEPEFSAEINRVSRAFEKEIDDKLFSHLKTAFNQALKSLLDFTFDTKVTELVPEKISEEILEIAEEKPVPEISDLIEEIRPVKPSPPEESLPPHQEKQNTGFPNRKPGFNWAEVLFMDEDENLRSRFIPETSTIEINSIHPDYKAMSKKDQRQLYIALLTAKEWALYNFKHADRIEVSEKMIELLVRVWKYLDKIKKM